MRWPRPVDVAFAVVLLAVGLLEIGVHRIAVQQSGLALVSVVAAALAMLIRSRYPMLCLAVFVAVGLIVDLETQGDAATAAFMVGLLVAIGTVGQRSANRLSFAAVLVATGSFASLSVFGARPWDALVWLGNGLAWFVGRFIRREEQRNERLIALAAELATEREARAHEEVEVERARIARELHDAVAHTVSVMTIQAAGVRRRLDAVPDRSRERDVLLDVERLGRQAVEELHRAVGVLRGPAVAVETPVSVCRLAHVDVLAARIRAAGVPVSIQVVGTPRPLPPGLELVAYRIVQESLTNILKHAGPARASIEISYQDDRLHVLVADDGKGPPMPVGAERTGGHGLTGMRERAAMYGGSILAGPGEHGGFAVRATFPHHDFAVPGRDRADT